MALLTSFRRWIRLLCIVVGVIGAVVVVLMMFLVTTDVIGRDSLNKSIFGAYELVELAMLVSVCAALGVTQSNNFHVKIDVLVSLLPRRWRAALDSIMMLLMLLFVGGVAWGGYGQALVIMARHATSTLLFIPRWPFQMWLVVGWGVFFLATLADFLVAVGHALGKDGDSAPSKPEEQLNVL